MTMYNNKNAIIDHLYECAYDPKNHNLALFTKLGIILKLNI